MSTYRRGRLDHTTAEHLLNAPEPGSPSGHRPIGELLVAATAPARDHEVAGEDAATTAFLAARDDTVPVTRYGTQRPRRIAVGLTPWIAATAVVVTAGVAVATGTRGDGTPSRRAVPNATAPTPTRPASSAPTRSPTTGTATPERARDAGLCQTYLSKSEVERDRSLATPTFRSLVESAGGRDRVEAYCRLVTATPSPGRGRPSRGPARTDPPRTEQPITGSSSTGPPESGQPDTRPSATGPPKSRQPDTAPRETQSHRNRSAGP